MGTSRTANHHPHDVLHLLNHMTVAADIVSLWDHKPRQEREVIPLDEHTTKS